MHSELVVMFGFELESIEFQFLIWKQFCELCLKAVSLITGRAVSWHMFNV